MNKKTWFIRTGEFFFKWRNAIFPVILLALFLFFPPSTEVTGNLGLEEIKDTGGFFLISAGLSFRIATIGWAYIKRGGLHKRVHATNLVTNGFFKLCRNPLYFGNMLLYAGFFLLHGHLLVILLGTGLFYFIYESIIAAEEYFLKKKFGEEYKVYCASTPRWIPDFRNYKIAVKDVSFSFERALAKDYTTIFNTLLAVVIIELWEDYTGLSPENFQISLKTAEAVITVLLAFVIAIKILKKKGKLAREKT